MTEAPQVSFSFSDKNPFPWSVATALWIGWAYQVSVLCLLLFVGLPQHQAYIDSLSKGGKPMGQITLDELSMMAHPTATLIGTAVPYIVMFALSVWLLRKTGQGRAWARNILTCLFASRILFSIVMYPNLWLLFDIIAMLAVIVLLFLPVSRNWFAAKGSR